MIQKIGLINSISSNNFNTTQVRKNNINNNTATNSLSLSGIPLSYISFKGKTDENNLKLTVGAKELLDKAEKLAEKYNHAEITPYHILQVAIEESELNNANLQENSEYIISNLHKLVNDFAKLEIVPDTEDFSFFVEQNEYLKTENLKYLNDLPLKDSDNTDKIGISDDLKNNLNDIKTEINEHILLGVAFNTLTYNGSTYQSDYLTSFQALNMYKTNDDIDKDYLETYDKKAIEVWNKLALGANLFVLSKHQQEKDRITASIVNTLNSSKHGNFSDNNTMIYAISDKAEPKTLISEIENIKLALPDKKLIFIMDLDDLLTKLIEVKSNNTMEYKPELYSLLNLPENNTKFIFLQDSNDNYQLSLIPELKKNFANFISYNIPPVQSYEVSDILKQNKHLMNVVSKPFNKDAKEKAIILAEKMDGVYPDKAIELMKRISEYYGDEVKKITTKEVDDFAYIASDILKQETDKTPIVYNTGKTLATYYGKETTKKDIENIVKQIKTGRIGTQGYIIHSKDEEAGAGKKHTAEVIAGEAKVPFLEIDSSDFEVSSYEDDKVKVAPAMAMTKIFNDIKLAAKQNPYKTAIVYINNFEDLVFSGTYYSGYKQAKTQLSREMEKAINEDINILVLGSTREGYAEYIPMFIKDFTQNIIVDSPAFNKKSRKEVLNSIIAKEKLPLSYRTKLEKEELVNKLVKLTEYFSYVQIKTLISKTQQIMLERNKTKAGIGEFIEAYLQLITGRTSQPELPMYNKKLITSHECGHATNLEVMNNIYRSKGQPWFKSLDVNFITLDPRGDFLGAVFEGRSENASYPFEAMFSNIVCSYGGHSCEKQFFDMDGSAGISQDLAQATVAAKRGIEYYGLGYYTGKISNAANIASGNYNGNVYKDLEVILTNAQIASDLITEGYKEFNNWFTQKYSKLIGSDNCMVDGDEFRKQLQIWIGSLSQQAKEELAIIDDIILDIIKASKNGKIYYQAKKVVK